MKNSAFSKPNTLWKNDERVKKDIEDDWNESMETVTRMINRITHIGHKATTVFKEMRLKRDGIRSNLHKILQELENLQKFENALEEAKLSQQNISSDIQKYSNYKQTVEIEYTEHVKSNYYSTICSSCSKVCYEDWKVLFQCPSIFLLTLSET